MEINYFVCTLGEVTRISAHRPYNNVNHLLQEQAKHHPNLPATGFYSVPKRSDSTEFGANILTFKEVLDAVSLTADLIAKSLEASPQERIALLSSSSPEFLFVWLGLIWLGHPVLLVAPECSPAGIAHLCSECDVCILVTDERQEKLGQSAAEQSKQGLRCFKQPFWGSNVFDVLKSTQGAVDAFPVTDPSSTAFFHHTSGTSSGKPKPIPQSHYGAVGALPAFDGQNEATFTTTPLYHGGPADTFRAWTSNAMIWFFPSKDVPITATNIGRCLECAHTAAEYGLCPPVKYLGAVPYVLHMMSEDDKGIEWMKRMDLVSVGGAALPDQLGDRLVEQGVNLVSRFGSAECGFLLSSHRDYDQDKAWQYLRNSSGPENMKFELHDGDLAELVVSSKWPHMAKRNREDGSYATSDVFQRHPDKPNAWRYHSRADAQLTLVTGLKFDPTSLEDAIVAASPLLSAVLVFGNQKPYPGAMLFRSQQAEGQSNQSLIQELAPIVEKCCNEGQTHAKISPSMLVPMPFSACPLEKSSKGTVLRGRAEDQYAWEIEQSYSQEDNLSVTQCSSEQLLETVREIVSNFLPSVDDVDPDADLFSLGIDSVASIQIRKRLEKMLGPSSNRLPITVVEDYGTVNRLVEHIERIQSGRCGSGDVPSNDHELMLQMVKDYSKFEFPDESISLMNGHSYGSGEVVLLTGATGTLGSHVLDELRIDPFIHKIYCLVRGADLKASYERLRKALSERHLRPMNEQKVRVLRAKMSEDKLGLDQTTYENLTREVTSIMHLAWSVNFRKRLRSFIPDIAGVRNLINLALSTKRPECPRITFCSSVASAMAYNGETVPEAILEDPSSASPLGYSQSKWVAEHICQKSSNLSRLRGRLSVVRVGQLSGSTTTGAWNMKEAWPLMLSTVRLCGSLPDLRNEVLNWLPVDRAATAMVEIAKRPAQSEDAVEVFHMLNDNREPTWTNLLAWLSGREHFETVSPLRWVEQLEKETKKGSEHPALSLLQHWKTSFEQSSDSSATIFDTRKTKCSIRSMENVAAVDEGYFMKLYDWIQSRDELRLNEA